MDAQAASPAGTGAGTRATTVAGPAGDLTFVTWPALDAAGVDAYVTTRDGGVSTGPYASLDLGLHVGDEPDLVVENRTRAAAAIGARLDDLVFATQVHSATATVVGRSDRGRGTRTVADAVPATDALVTADPGVVLVIMVADCVPIVLYDPVARVAACVHAGWTGTVRGVTPAAVRTMTGLGADPARLVAGIGPSIAPDRYQVGADVRDAAAAAFGDRVDEVVRPDGTGRWTFDLWSANRHQLVDAGVPAAAVHVAGLDTGPGTPFFSHRAGAPTGRFAALVRLR